MDYLTNLINNYSQFIGTWGYVIVFLGACIEGESIILTASALAYYGYLSIYKIAVIAFIATLMADQLLFWLGYYKSASILHYFSKHQQKIDRVFNLLHRYNTLFILTFRFIYGIRTLSPVVIGIAKIEPKRYALLNFIAALFWAITSCTLGYMFASKIALIISNVHYFVMAILVIVVIFIGYKLLKKK